MITFLLQSLDIFMVCCGNKVYPGLSAVRTIVGYHLVCMFDVQKVLNINIRNVSDT